MIEFIKDLFIIIFIWEFIKAIYLHFINKL